MLTLISAELLQSKHLPVRYALSSVWLSVFSQLSITQYVGLCVFSLRISLVMIERIYILCLIIIIQSEVWTITHCLGLGHETMVRAVCLSISLWASWRLKSPATQLFVQGYVPAKNKEASKVHVAGPFWGNHRIHTKWPVIRKAYPCNDAILEELVTMLQALQWWRH